MATATYSIDHLHSSVGFTVRHMVVSKVHGQFTKWSAQLALDEADLTRSSVDVRIDVGSVDTRVGDRDNHLRSADFFDVAHHPEMTFQSRRIERLSDTEYRLIGDLTLRGVTREVALQTELNGREKSPWGDERLGFSAHASILRSDWGLVYNKALETGGMLVGDKVDIHIELEVVKQAAATPRQVA